MKNTRKISLIVIHCSATRVTQDFTFEKLEACHLARGFRSIGYHYYITKDGVIYPGRPESEIPPFQCTQYRHLLRRRSRRRRQSGRYPYEGSEAVAPESPDKSVRRLSRSRDPRSSWSPERPQVLSLLQCSGLAEWNQFPHLALYSVDIVHTLLFFLRFPPILSD